MKDESEPARYDLRSRQFRFLGLTKDLALKGLFGGNALVSILVLALITFSLFKEGAGFFGQYREDLGLYRRSGLEYVQIMREEQESFAALNRYVNSVREDRSNMLRAEGIPFSEVRKILAEHDDFYRSFERLGDPLREYVLETNEVAMKARDTYIDAHNLQQRHDDLVALGRLEEAEAIKVPDFDLGAAAAEVKAGEPAFLVVNHQMLAQMETLLASVPHYGIQDIDAKLERAGELAEIFRDEVAVYEKELVEWDRDTPVGFFDAFTGFVFGRDWTTNSSIQDWFGLLPLLTGSLLVSSIALCIAVPLGVGAAVYVSQVAKPAEQNLIKPYIEFISAIPSVVIGFFGIAIFGELVRTVSQSDALSWISFFPISERLNAFTAGCLLALMAIPTIFTLAEDSLNNVPKSFKEASLAMGATRLQTIVRIIVPTSLSGILSAVLLGFGRVVGETMVVLLCAGNRITIPDITEGIGVVFEPVHTMTGIIAQELGEVVNGSIHYRALFMVGISLFVLSLVINYFAQKIVLKYQIARG